MDRAKKTSRQQPVEPWSELGLQPGVDEDAIQHAYRKLVRRYPPELASEKFTRIQEAYETLRSPGRVLRQARNRPSETLKYLYPVSILQLSAEPEPPPPPDRQDLAELIGVARRAVAEELLRILAANAS